ncbi:c-type cytochrome biogenesis protein CcsB [Leucobacter denitrificans]|uniref:C-type cytochrome biogenesis protein CcsB n=2 Tax=Leucobacter denitrificans TaxID=683042 RepID=A0A7G9S7T9_9MICO|nr:c-type cytochrome biogenesis protein CcsB [Leucobacter denitrificans]QNN63914.1 c-type cytochrome biogenesis protein CcsB [Leucobacter denitrificans]
MIVYAIAFVFYVVDLANRSGDLVGAASAGSVKSASAQGGSAQSASAQAAGGNTTVLTRQKASASTRQPQQPRSRWMRSGFALTVLGFVLHAGATVLRGIGAERVPWANMYEFALTATLAVVALFLIVQFFVDIRFLGALVVGMAVVFLGVAKVNYYVEIVPLVPALDSYWLVIHILVAVLGVGVFTLSFGLSILQLLQARRANQKKAGAPQSMAFMSSMPNAVRLEDLAYRLAIIGFAFWTFTLIAGSIWAEAAWSRYWGWDVKEVWTFVIWVLYAGFIHARATRGWRGSRSAWLNIVAYAAVIFNFTVVNVFFKGLHAYSGL